MEDYAALIDCEPGDLTADQRSSLEYYYASVNVSEGLPVDTGPRRWCVMAQDVARVAHMLGRVPEAGDPGATAAILEWISLQRGAPLNGYQRARLAEFPGGGALAASARMTG